MGLLPIGFHQFLELLHSVCQAGIHFKHDPEFCYPVPTRREFKAHSPVPKTGGPTQEFAAMKRTLKKTEANLVKELRMGAESEGEPLVTVFSVTTHKML